MRVAILILLLVLVGAAEARDPAQVRAFRKLHPCPATGHVRGACRGWVVDHKTPLCLQPLYPRSLDTPENMQWMEKRAALEKDKQEWAACRQLRSCKR